MTEHLPANLAAEHVAAEDGLYDEELTRRGYEKRVADVYRRAEFLPAPSEAPPMEDAEAVSEAAAAPVETCACVSEVAQLKARVGELEQELAELAAVRHALDAGAQGPMDEASRPLTDADTIDTIPPNV